MQERIPSEHFRLLFEAAPGPFLVLLPDSRFTIVGASAEYLRATLTTREQIIGRSLFEVFPDNPATPEAASTSNLSRSLQRVLAQRSSDVMALQRYDVPRADGQGFELRYWSPVNAPVFDADGTLLYIVHRVENVTDYVMLREEHRRQRGVSERLTADKQKMEAEIVARSLALDGLNAELRRANADLAEHARRSEEEGARKDEFQAMLAHELRNPLAAISSALQLSELKAGDVRAQQEATAICRRQVRHLVRMVDDLLDASRIGRGALELARAPLDLRDILESALHAVRAPFERQEVAIATHVAAARFPMLGDATRLEQVLVNLLTNAAKYSEKDGKVEVRLAPAELDGQPWARIEVADQGHGIPAGKLDAIFDMFVQVDAGLDRSRGGLGIGLSVVRALVEMHGGRVRAHSAGLGHGATFVVELPLAPRAQAPDRDAAHSLPAPAGAGARRILVVEDNQDARQTLRALLAALGHVVATAETGEEGLRRMIELAPEVAIVDIGLPGLDGMEVARRACRELDGRRPVLVALSGYSSPAARRMALDAGFDHHLVKPFDPEALATVLAR